MGCCGKKSPEDGDTEQTRRPSDNKFKQQKLPAWQPILTASTVLPLFFFVGIVFLPIGITLLVTSNNIKELVIDYSEDQNCISCKTAVNAKLPSENNPMKPSNCSCKIEFELTEPWAGDVYFYYGLTNFYQNHRRYVRSRDYNQLNGKLSQTPSSDCDPYEKDKNGKAIVPCGAIANSMFNDKFKLTKVDTNIEVPMSDENIAWKSDRETKFKNPSGDFNKVFNGYAKPPYWFQNITELGTKDGDRGLVNQDFIIWMRVAAFPNFRKLYRKLDHTKVKLFADRLPSGKYDLEIEYNYPVKAFGGKKQFILTTPSWIGGKNPFLGIAYIVVGCLCLIFGFVFLVIHMKVRTRPLTA